MKRKDRKKRSGTFTKSWKSIKPDSDRVQGNIGVALTRKGGFKEPVVYHRKAILLDPKYWRAQKNLEETLRQLRAVSP